MKRIPLSPRALAPFFLMALSVSAWAQEGNDRAQRYYESLLKRPVPGAAFDRFYGAWLDTDTLESLEKWLLKQADAPDAPVGSRLLLAYFYSRQSEPAKAVEQFNKALAREPENAEAWYQKAMASARLLDSASALKDLEKATRAKPSKLLGARILQAQGRLLARQGQPEEARRIWQELMAASPDDEDLAEDLIDLQITEGLYDDALATTNKLLVTTRDPYKKVQRKLRLAEIYLKSGKRDNAVKVWRDCLEDTGSDSWLEKEILAQLELAFRREDAMTPLLDEMSALSARYPQRLSLRRNYAKLLAETGDTDGAVKVFQGILDLTPGDRGSREAFVDLLKNNNRPADAAAQLEELVKLNPADLELLSRLADLQAENHEKDKAKASMELFLTKSDQTEASWLRVAAALERYGLLADSLAQYQKSAAKFPESESVRDAWAVALHAQGKKEEAFKVWRALVKGADGGRLASVVRSVSARGEHGLAYEFLKAGEMEFGRDPLFLTLLCEEAVEVGKAEEALPWARRLVVLSRDAVDLETSVGRIIKLAERSEKVDELRNQLQTETLTAQEKCLLAELLDRHADPHAADALLQEVAETEPELATALLVRLQGQRNDYAGAAESLKKLVESPGGRKSVHAQRLVELYRRAGKADEALAWIPEWKKLSPGSVLPWQTEADLQFEAGKGKEALRVLRQAAQEFEGNEDIKAMLASAYQSEGQLADAQRVFMALYENAEDTSARIRWAGAMAEVAQDAGRTEDLVETFQQRHRANANSLAPLLALAEIYRVTDNYDGRRKTLLDAVRVKPGDVELLMEIARLAEREEKYDDALQTLRDTLPLDKSGKVRQMITRVLFAAGREEEGMRGLRDYFSGTPDAGAVENVADSLASQKLWGPAADFLLQQLPSFPDNYRLYYYCAVALEEDGRGVGSFDPAAALEGSKTGEDGNPEPSGPGAASLLLKVQGMTRELPAPTLPGPGTRKPVRPPGPDYFDEMAKVLPPGAMRITRLTNSVYQAYQYRQRNQRAGGPGGFGGGLNVPQKLDDVKAMAQVHLLGLAQELSPAGRTQLEEELTAGGLPYAGWLMDSGLAQVTSGNRQLDFREILQKYPEDESLNALLVLRGANDQTIQEDELLEARRVLVKNWPVMARMAGLGLARGESGQAQEAFRQTVDELVAAEKPPGMVLMNGVTQLLYQMNNRRGQSMPLTSRTKFAELQRKILPWLRADDQQRGNLSYIFLQLAAGLADSEGDLTPLADMLDEEIAYWNAEPDKNVLQSRMVSNSSNRVPPVVQEMPFPPEKLPDFPPQVLQVLNGQGLRIYGLALASDPDQWKKVLPSVKDPLLRVLVAGMTDEPPAIERELQALNSAPEPKAAGLMLAAAYAGKQEKYAEAVGWLLKAQDLPLDRDIRRTMDSACLAWSMKVLEEKPDTPEADPVRQAGRESALRMRRGNLNSAQRSELAEVFETMGLTREAGRMAASAVTAQAGPQGGPGISAMISGFSNNRSQLQQLVDKGKRADAVKISLRQLHDYSRIWVSNNDGSIRYMTQEWLQEVRRSALLRDLQEALRAETKDDAVSLAQRGAAWEIIGDTKTAIPLYRSALGKKPKDSGVQIALAFALMARQPKEALPILSEINAAQFAGMTNALQNMANQMQDFEGRFALLEVVTAIVDRITPEQAVKLDLSWALYIMESVVQQGYSNADGFQIGSLYEQGTDGEDDPPVEGKTDANRSKIEAAQNRRMELHSALCRSLMRLPGVADPAFRRYSGVARSKGLKNPTVEELDKLAMGVVEVESLKRNGNSNGGRRYYYSNYNRGIRMMSPEEWLMERAWQAKTPERIATELIPAIRKQGPAAVRAVEEMQKLYFCADADFGKEVAEYLKRRQRTQIQGESQTHLETILRIMSLRGLDADLTEAVAGAVEAANGTYSSGQELNPALDYAGYLMERKGPQATRTFLSRITGIILGPKARREDFLEKNYKPNGFSSNSGMAIYRWIQMLRTGVNRTPLVLPLFSLLEDEFIPYLKPPNDNQVILHNYGSAFQRANALPDKPEEFLEFIRNTPLVADAAGFRSFPGPPQSTQSPVVELLRRLGNLQQRKEIADAVDTLPKTFGTELMTRILRGDSGRIADSVAETLTAHLDEIKALPPEKWGNFTILRNAFESGNPTEATAAFDAWSKELQSKGNTKQTEKLLAAKVARDLAPSDAQVISLLQPAVSGMVLSGDVRLEESLLKLRALFAAERKSRGVNQSNSNNGSSVLGRMLVTALNQRMEDLTPEKATQSVEGLLNALGSAEGYPIEWSLSTAESFQKILLPAVTVVVERKRTTRLKAFTDSIKITDPASSLLFGPLKRILKDKNLVFSAEDAAWLAAAPQDAPGMLGLILAARPPREEEIQVASDLSEGGPAAAWIEDRLKDQKLPPHVRFGLLLEILKGSKNPSRAAVSAAVSNLAETWKDGNPVPDSAAGLVISSLNNAMEKAEPAFLEASRPAVSDLAAAWRRSLADAVRNPGSYGYRPLRVMRSRTSRAFLSLFLTMNDTSGLNSLLNAMGVQVDRNWLAELVAHGQDDAARRLVSSMGQGLLANQPDSSSYSKALADHLPAFLAGIPDLRARTMAEAMLVSLPDSQKPPDGETTDEDQKDAGETADAPPPPPAPVQPAPDMTGVPDRKARMAILLEHVPLDAFKTRSELEPLVMLLKDEEGLSDKMETLISRYLEGDSLAAAAMAEDQNQREVRCFFLRKEVIQNLKAGNIPPVETVLRELEEVSQDGQNYYVNQEAQKLYPLLQESITTSWNDWKPEVRVSARNLWLGLSLDAGKSDRLENVDAGRLGLTLFLYALENDMKSFARMVTSRPAVVQEEFRNRMAAVELKDITNADKYPWTGTPEEIAVRKSEILLRILSQPVILPGVKALEGRYFQAAVETGWISRDVLLTSADFIVADGPQDAVTPGEVAIFQVTAGQPEAAEKNLALALSRQPPDDFTGAAKIVLLRTTVLEKQGRAADALALLNEFKPSETLDKPLQDGLITRAEQLKLIVILQSGGPEKLIADYVSGLTEKPEDADEWMKVEGGFELSGQHLMDQGDMAGAADHFGMAAVIVSKLAAEDPKKYTDELHLPARAWQDAAKAAKLPGAPRTLVTEGATWSYSGTAAAAPNGWMAMDFEDKTWKSGPAPIGYGNSWLKTNISPGDSQPKPFSLFLRTSFDTLNTSGKLSLQLQCVDGAVVYLNGQEIARANLPEGPLKADSPATSPVTGGDQRKYTRLVVKGRDLLQPGRNVVAVELHQDRPDSPDLSMDLSLHADDLEPWEAVQKLDPAKLAGSLGKTWSQLPVTFRDLILAPPESVEKETGPQSP